MGFATFVIMAVIAFCTGVTGLTLLFSAYTQSDYLADLRLRHSEITVWVGEEVEKIDKRSLYGYRILTGALVLVVVVLIFGAVNHYYGPLPPT